MNRLQKVIISIISLVVLIGVFALAASTILSPNQKTPIKKLLPEKESTVRINGDYTVASWIWHYPTEIEKDIEKMFEFAQKEGINTIYLYVDEYIDIYELPEGEDKNKDMMEYAEALKSILNEAKSKNLTVHALSGNTTYSYDTHSYIPPIIINHIYEFNEQNPDIAFEGIQFDIEFYEDELFFDDTNEYTDNFIRLASNSAILVKGLNEKYDQNLKLGYVIPFWFDEQNEYFAEPILPDIIEPLTQLDGSYIVVMAYRNNIDDIIKISEVELIQADEVGIDVIIAQEIGRNKDNKITHFGKSRDEIKEVLNQIIERQNFHPSFIGVSIHDFSAFMDTL